MASEIPYEQAREVARFVHRCQHLDWRRNGDPLPEAGYISECWMPYQAPSWALSLAASGEPGSRWCPLIDPGLMDRAEVEHAIQDR
jgi:hypothetical protein